MKDDELSAQDRAALAKMTAARQRLVDSGAPSTQRAGKPEHRMATDPSMSRPEGAVRAAMALVPDISPTDVGSVELMLDGGEWVLAFEVMCEQAFEYDVPVSREALDTIRALGRELGARDYYADLLRATVRD